MKLIFFEIIQTEELIKQRKWDQIPADYKDGYKRTAAMIACCICRLKDLPKKFYHDPEIADYDNWTVAMFAAAHKCI